MKFDDMIHDAIGNGGGTYLYSGGFYYKPEYETGFYVSEPRGIENLPYLDKGVIRQFIAQRITPSIGIEYLGLWRDEFGNWSVDVSTWVDDRTAALIRGSLNNQRAVWDIVNGSALNVVAELHPLLYV